MGVTKVKLMVKNPRTPALSAEDHFLVDTGAHYTVLPSEMVRKLKLRPSHIQEFVLADGRIVKRTIGGALIHYERKELPVAVVFGEKDDSPLLGVITLETFGLMIDPFTRRMYPSKLMLG